MKKENLIVAFYIIYFGWLFTITYLTQDVKILNPFSLAIVAFYFIFLREKGDLSWFLLGCTISVWLAVFPQVKDRLPLVYDAGNYWLPISWGTTLLALRKLVLIIEK